ncbi:hypothetical protein NM208_g6589 [Fusarium decemcellulare]|uniref:Uncharacterized protein n=1 Tax=Fusarium decemcellulare TaxID=57161 RepID=A0ACC1SCV4_9HYPO|nr:hypothetical protein NM208_g6589 [Fusarium decemcellulare]
MSGLEPLAALGLACNIMQIITFTGESISICRRIYNGGQPDSGLHDYSQRLLRTSESLRDIISRSTGNLSLDDQALRDSAERCINIADNLMKEMQSLSTPKSQNGLRSSLRQGVKTIFRKPRLERLENDLRNIQSAMHTELLVRTLDRLDVSAIQQQSTVTESRHLLDDTLRQYSAKHDNFAKNNLETKDQLLQAITAATARIEGHTTSELSKNTQLIQGHMGTIATHTQQHATNFREWTNSAAEEAAYQRILQSLKFDSMEERKNQICENYPKTFHWIYEPRHRETTASEDPESEASISSGEDYDEDFWYESDEADREFHTTDWDSFMDWLKSEDSMYWISGKPGSGKSTLMKFISSNPETQAGLNAWRPESRILSHYFWKAGSQLQHSLKGFLCSLVYQIFRLDRVAALAYLRQTPDLPSHRSSTSDWGMAELQKFLLDHIRQSTTPICIFVDGLDELVPQYDIHDLLSLLDNLSELGLKLCVSSRAEIVFQNHLRHHKTLKMHDLIQPDIAEYARGALCRAISPTYQEFDISSLVRSIIWKAEGVFLWVVLVSKSLVRGIENGDSNDELQQRLGSMPGDLMLLYKDMWQRSNEDHEIYRTTSCWYFNIVLAAGHVSDDGSGRVIQCLRHNCISIFELMAAMDSTFLERFSENIGQLSMSELERRCCHTANSVETRSAGILQVIKNDIEPCDPGRYGSAVAYASMTVNFVHRTARDYLVETEDGRSLWQMIDIPTEDIRSRLVQASLLRCQIWKFDSNLIWSIPPSNSVDAFLESIRWTRKKTGKVHQARLLSRIEAAGSRGDLDAWASAINNEVGLLACEAMHGFRDHVVTRLRGMQPSKETLHPILLECCKCCFYTTSGKKVVKERLVERDHVIRHLLTQGSNPNPVQGRTPGNVFAVDAPYSPWFNYLLSTLDYLFELRNTYGTGPSLEASEEILETLGVFIDSGAWLGAGNALLSVKLREANGSNVPNDCVISGYDLDDFPDNFPANSFILHANAPWLIKAVLIHLHPDVNITRLDYEKDPLSTKALLVSKFEQEEEEEEEEEWGGSHTFYVIDREEKSRFVTSMIFQWFQDSTLLCFPAIKDLHADIMKTMDNILQDAKSRSGSMSWEEADTFLKERGYLI